MGRITLRAILYLTASIAAIVPAARAATPYYVPLDTISQLSSTTGSYYQFPSLSPHVRVKNVGEYSWAPVCTGAAAEIISSAGCYELERNAKAPIAIGTTIGSNSLFSGDWSAYHVAVIPIVTQYYSSANIVGSGGTWIPVASDCGVANDPLHGFCVRDNNGTGGYWQRDTFGMAWSPLWAGAYNDGTNAATTTAAFQAVVNYAEWLTPSLQNEPEIMCTGNYAISTQLEFYGNLYSPPRLRNCSFTATSGIPNGTPTSPANSAVIHVSGSASYDFKNIVIACNNTNQTGLLVENSKFGHADDPWITGCFSAMTAWNRTGEYTESDILNGGYSGGNTHTFYELKTGTDSASSSFHGTGMGPKPVYIQSPLTAPDIEFKDTTGGSGGGLDAYNCNFNIGGFSNPGGVFKIDEATSIVKCKINMTVESGTTVKLLNPASVQNRAMLQGSIGGQTPGFDLTGVYYCGTEEWNGNLRLNCGNVDSTGPLIGTSVYTGTNDCLNMATGTTCTLFTPDTLGTYIVSFATLSGAGYDGLFRVACNFNSCSANAIVGGTGMVIAMSGSQAVLSNVSVGGSPTARVKWTKQ